jgi:hypothetical protein
VVAGAGGGGSSGGGGGGGSSSTAAVSLTEDRLRAVVREEVRARVEEVTISGASIERMSRLLEEAAGVVEAVQGDIPQVPDTFLPDLVATFSWAGGEDANTPAACAILSQYLSAAGAPMAPATASGFKLLDVHRYDYLTTHICNVKLKGKTDAVIVPSTQVVVEPIQQARVVIDFKTPDRSGLRAVYGQAKAELLASTSLSHHDVLVVFTDLGAHNHILRGYGDKLMVWEDLHLRSMIYIVSQFLSTECARVGVPDIDDPRVPGPPERKVRRKEFMKAIHDARPSAEPLLDQLAAFNGGTLEDFLERRELVYSWMPDSEPFPS